MLSLRRRLRAGARQLYIQTQATPNPESMKFVPVLREELRLLPDDAQSVEFSSWEESKSPLARDLFRINGVSQVFIAPNYVTVTIDNEDDWLETKPLVFAAVMDFLQSGAPALDDGVSLADDPNLVQEGDSEAVVLIKKILDKRVRPNVQDDGGDVVFRRFDEEEGILYLELLGACRGCSSSSVTLKHGIERMMREFVDEVETVEEWTEEHALYEQMADEMRRASKHAYDKVPEDTEATLAEQPEQPEQGESNAKPE